MTGYASWCFYCQKPQGTPEALRKHVMADHPTSPRASRYRQDRAEEEPIVATAESTADYDIEVTIRRDGEVIATGHRQVKTKLRMTAYATAESAARDAVSAARKMLGEHDNRPGY